MTMHSTSTTGSPRATFWGEFAYQRHHKKLLGLHRGLNPNYENFFQVRLKANPTVEIDMVTAPTSGTTWTAEDGRPFDSIDILTVYAGESFGYK